MQFASNTGDSRLPIQNVDVMVTLIEAQDAGDVIKLQPKLDGSVAHVSMDAGTTDPDAKKDPRQMFGCVINSGGVSNTVRVRLTGICDINVIGFSNDGSNVAQSVGGGDGLTLRDVTGGFEGTMAPAVSGQLILAVVMADDYDDVLVAAGTATKTPVKALFDGINKFNIAP